MRKNDYFYTTPGAIAFKPHLKSKELLAQSKCSNNECKQTHLIFNELELRFGGDCITDFIDLQK